MNRLLPLLLTSLYLLVSAQMLLVQVGHELAHAWEARLQGIELRHHHHHHHHGDETTDHHHGDYVETVLSLETQPEEAPGRELTRLRQLDVHQAEAGWQPAWLSLAPDSFGRKPAPACPQGGFLPDNPPPEENIA